MLQWFVEYQVMKSKTKDKNSAGPFFLVYMGKDID